LQLLINKTIEKKKSSGTKQFLCCPRTDYTVCD